MMLMLILQVLTQVSCNPSFYTEEILSLQSELRTLAKARNLLTQKESQDVFTLFPATDSHWSAHRLVPKSHLVSESDIKGTCFISLKPMQSLLHPSNIGVLILHSSGLLELREVTGGLLYKLDLGYEPTSVAATNSIDEMKFSVLSSGKLEIFGVIIEKPVKPIVVEDLGLQTSSVFISLYREVELELPGPASIVSLYIKSGKKYWAVALDDGKLGLVGFNGKVESLNDLESGKINSIDRFGPFIVVSTDSATGPVNMNTWKINPACPSGGQSLSLDSTNTSSIVHVTDGQSIKTFDFRSVKAEQFTCKEIRSFAYSCSKIYSTKDFLACLKDGELKMIEGNEGKIKNTIRVIGKHEKEGMIGFRTNSGDYYLAITGGNELAVFEVFIGKTRSAGGLDMSIAKFAMIGIVIIVVAYYQYSKAKKPKVSKDKKNN